MKGDAISVQFKMNNMYTCMKIYAYPVVATLQSG